MFIAKYVKNPNLLKYFSNLLKPLPQKGRGFFYLCGVNFKRKNITCGPKNMSFFCLFEIFVYLCTL